MRQRLVIFITIALVIGVLIALNATSYVSPEQKTDSEVSPDRSTYNGGATGTRALFDFLSETGRKVVRWRDVQDRRALHSEMRQLTNSFENHWYGFAAATPDDWAAFRARYQQALK